MAVRSGSLFDCSGSGGSMIRRNRTRFSLGTFSSGDVRSRTRGPGGILAGGRGVLGAVLIYFLIYIVATYTNFNKMLLCIFATVSNAVRRSLGSLILGFAAAICISSNGNGCGRCAHLRNRCGHL